MRIIICLLALFVNTALASPLFDKFEIAPKIDVKLQLSVADAVVIGRFTGKSHRYLFNGYDENGQPKKRLLTADYDPVKAGFDFGFVMAEWEFIVGEELFIKEGVTVDDHITLVGAGHYGDYDSEANRKSRELRSGKQFMIFLRPSETAKRTGIKNHFSILTSQSLIKLGDEIKALYHDKEWPIHAAEEGDQKKGKNGIQRMKAKIKKSNAFISTLSYLKL